MLKELKEIKKNQNKSKQLSKTECKKESIEKKFEKAKEFF